mmetsp:Transcript_13983/g.35329  ORF Transcript_13983/g.35329 Transcript_13983/m.35329 type:complete len:297 (+) Transcript_13983:116-1006(+)
MYSSARSHGLIPSSVRTSISACILRLLLRAAAMRSARCRAKACRCSRPAAAMPARASASAAAASSSRTRISTIFSASAVGPSSTGAATGCASPPSRSKASSPWPAEKAGACGTSLNSASGASPSPTAGAVSKSPPPNMSASASGAACAGGAGSGSAPYTAPSPRATGLLHAPAPSTSTSTHPSGAGSSSSQCGAPRSSPAWKSKILSQVLTLGSSSAAAKCAVRPGYAPRQQLKKQLVEASMLGCVGQYTANLMFLTSRVRIWRDATCTVQSVQSRKNTEPLQGPMKMLQLTQSST